VDEGEVRELQEERSRLFSLREHPGYEYLMRIAEAQVTSRQASIMLTPLQSMDEVLRQEYAKGEVSGIALFSRIVDIRIRDLEEQITERLDGTE
jgi:hypothetical protein